MSGLLGVVVVIAALGCQDPYPIAATACDDFCHATQRAGCQDDYPDDCVSQCEAEGVSHRFPECETEWLAVSDCYSQAEASDFSCVDDLSRPENICIESRTQLASCIAPSAALCFEDCRRQAEACGTAVGTCDESCAHPTPGCEQQAVEFYNCNLKAPVDCGSDDAESPELRAVPCLNELDALFTCVGL